MTCFEVASNAEKKFYLAFTIILGAIMKAVVFES